MPELVASTPVNDALRRRTILRNALDGATDAAGTISPLRRRSSANATLNESVAVACDDNEERQRRRSVVSIQKRLSSVASTTKSPSTSVNDSVRFAGDKELQEHLQTCAKLYNENKINANNAWRLKIIDVLKQISRTDSSDTLQIASKSLDVSSRVYSIRVDDAYDSGRRLAGSMSRMAEAARADDGDAADADAADDADAKANKKGRAKKRKRFLVGGEKKTVAKDAAANLGELPMLESVLFSARTKPEATAVDNLFTNILKTDDTGTTFELLGEKPFWCADTTIDETLRNTKMVPALKLDLSHSKLCHDLLRDFCLDEWDPDEELKNDSTLLSTNPPIDKDLVFDDQGLPIPELDGSVHDIFADAQIELDDIEGNNDENVNGNVNAQEDFVFAHPSEPMSRITSFLPSNSAQSQALEYSYNPLIVTQSGRVVEQIWAGPSHWKLKAIRQSAQRRFTGQRRSSEGGVAVVGKRKCGRRPAPPQRIEFVDGESDDEDKENSIANNLNSNNLNSNKSHGGEKFKRIAVKRGACASNLRSLFLPVLEESLHRWEADLLKLQLIDSVELRHKKKPEENCKNGDGDDKSGDDNDNYEIGDYNYGNCNDSLYCPESGGGDGGGDEGNFEEEDVAVDKNAAVEFVGENLVDVPDLVAKTTIHFATHAKKMDMKKLKNATWCIMTGAKQLEENSKTANDIQPINFSTLYRTLPKLISEKMRQNLSPHLAFLAVLHITNEHNLHLSQDKNRNQFLDFEIRPPDGA